MENFPVKNVISVGLVLLVLVGFGSWKASEYVGENKRVRDENVSLKAKVAEQEKEIDKLNERLQQVYPGWRPGTPIGSPIGNPAGSTSPTGATPK
jgi:hypothetical protein